MNHLSPTDAPASLIELLHLASVGAEQGDSAAELERGVRSLFPGTSITRSGDQPTASPTTEPAPDPPTHADADSPIELPIVWNGRRFGTISANLHGHERAEGLLALRLAAVLLGPVLATEALYHEATLGDRKETTTVTENSLEASGFPSGSAIGHALRGSKSDMADLAHDLRTPLTSVRAYNELLSDDPGAPLTPDQQRCAQAIEEACTRMASLIEKALELYR